MEWLNQQEHQGIALLIAVFQLIITGVYYPLPESAPPLERTERILRAAILLLAGWVIYSIPWALLAFSMGFPPAMVLSPLFIVLGGFAVIGALTTKSPRIGGFIGGSVPLATLSLFYLSANPELQETGPPLAWFAMFMIFGGMLGVLAGPTAMGVTQAVRFGAPFRRKKGKSQADLPSPRGQLDRPFDVFLSHNSKDKPAVRQLTEALEARGLKVWLDEQQLVPGRPWQKELEEIIETARTAAVLVGRDSLGPWETEEMRACLSQFVKRHLPVIPVLLPNATTQPQLPLFLQEFTWVDLRSGLTGENLDRLEWGITGVKPGQSTGKK